MRHVSVTPLSDPLERLYDAAAAAAASSLFGRALGAMPCVQFGHHPLHAPSSRLSTCSLMCLFLGCCCHAVAGALPTLDPRINYSHLLKPALHISPPYGAWMNE